MGVLAPSSDGRPSTEDTPSDIKQMVGHYKASKFIAEREVDGFVKKGLPVVIVNPSTPIGAMDRKPTPTGQIIVDFLNGRIPAYLDTGLNMVDVEDVAAGHLLAAERGRIGERYILGNRNMTLRELFELLAGATGRPAPTVRLPYLPVLLAAHIDTGLSKVIPGRKPRIPLTGRSDGEALHVLRLLAGQCQNWACPRARWRGRWQRRSPGSRRTATSGMMSAECGVRSAECGMRNAECGMRNAE